MIILWSKVTISHIDFKRPKYSVQCMSGPMIEFHWLDVSIRMSIDIKACLIKDQKSGCLVLVTVAPYMLTPVTYP